MGVREKKVAKNGPRVHIAAAVITIGGLTCSPGPDGKSREIEGPGGGSSYGSVAHAAEEDAGNGSGVGGTSQQPIMPDNPSHISLRFPRVPKVVVTLNDGVAFPYNYKVAEEGDYTVVTIYIPQGETVKIAIAAVDEDGKPVFDRLLLDLEPEGKIGTHDISFDMVSTVLKFPAKDEALQLGGNPLEGPVGPEFIEGTQRIMQGIYEADRDHICRVDWIGTQSLFAFLDGPPVCHSEPFEVPLKAGQKLGLYPIIGEESEGVGIRLTDPDREE